MADNSHSGAKFFVCITIVIGLVSCQRTDPLFMALTSEQTGIDFINEVIAEDSFNILHKEYMYNGGGVGVADLNNDGLQDLVFAGNKVQARIYLNKGNFKFQDISKNFEGLTKDRWISGVSAVDINGDGWVDLYFSATFEDDPTMRRNQLWINQGLKDGLPYFEESALAHGIGDTGSSVHSAFFDYDLDGDLDLYILINMISKEIPSRYRYKVVDGTARNNDKLYRNNGDGSFTNVTVEAGIVYEGYGLGIGIGDFNKDNFPDLYISNDYIANDILYLNQGDGTFRNISESHLSYHSRFSMGNDVSDINNDGNPDILSLDMLPELYARKKSTIEGNSYLVYQHDERYGYQNKHVRNMLHLNNGTLNGQLLSFSEIGQLAGVYQTEWSWSALFADYDNDGDRDLTITNGFPKDLTDKDFSNYKAELYGYLIGDKELLPKLPVVKVPNYVFENTGDLSFIDRSREWGFRDPSFTHGAAYVDLDNDGDLDFVANKLNDPATIYRNSSRDQLLNNYLRIELEGDALNSMAIGSKLELWIGEQYQYYEHFLSRGYASSVDPVIHFGLGAAEVVDSLQVTWPGGKKKTLIKHVSANQKIIVNITDAFIDQPSKSFSAFGMKTMFEPAKLIQYLHIQEDYVDFFQRQRIIPHKFSQIGPCMAQGDINGDGIEDLFVGGSEGSTAQAFLFDGEHFRLAHMEGLTNQKQCLESDIAIIDVENDGDNDLIALSGGYAKEEDDYVHYLYRNEGGRFVKSALPLKPFIASVVRPIDFDQDGDQDLFIGCRVKRGYYPQSKASYVLVNNGTGFTESDLWSFDLGMVTDAKWSDFNGDGWADLMISREWNSPVVLMNIEGKKLEIFHPEEIAEMHGFWSSVTAADLDGDGDDDYILGNLGENHRFSVSGQYPLRIYSIDVDGNGTIDPLSTGYWKDEYGMMQEYPIHYLDELAAQSPFFRRKFTSYAQFSRAIVDSLVDKTAIADSDIFQVNTTASHILWNVGQSKVIPQKLPKVAQTSVVREILVRDFDGDMKQDILLLGNDYTYDVSTGYYDANKGILLTYQGDQSFKVVPTRESGIHINGQVESLLYFEGQPGVLVVGINRDSILTFTLNKQDLKVPLQ